MAKEMLVGGRLEYREDGKCFVVHADKGDGPEEVAPIWPDGVEPVKKGDERGVKVPGFGTIMEGETVEASGSFLDADDKMVKSLELDKDCRPGGGFVVFNKESFT
ncbi:hypothetical protein JNUCC64_13980 [Streptomyces sp. JNUCC 64]